MGKNSLSLAFVGDISYGNCLFTQGFGVRSTYEKNNNHVMLEQVRGVLKKNDIVFGNLETVISRLGEDTNRLSSVDMRGEPECVHDLKKSGFNLLNIANNHIMQHGIDPFNETVDLLRFHGMGVVGLKGSGLWHSEPVIINSSAVKVGILGYAFEKDRYHSGELPYAFGVDARIENDIEMLKKSVDLLIVSLHWGCENMDYPHKSEVLMARRMIDKGADIIIGHHPHVLRGIERYKDKIIAYSLGNFLFDMLWDKRFRESMVLEIKYSPGKKLDFNVVPVLSDFDCRPNPVYGRKGKNLLKRIKDLSSKIDRDMKRVDRSTQICYKKEFNRLEWEMRIKSYGYFFLNFYRYKKKYFFQQLLMTLYSRLEDVGVLQRKQ